MRLPARVPASTWDALINHLRDPADAAPLADSAERRLLYRYAIPLYRHAADAATGTPAGSWPICWPTAGDLDRAEQILRPIADAGHGYAAEVLTRLLADRGTWISCQSSVKV